MHWRDGKWFTAVGIGAMFRRYCGPEKPMCRTLACAIFARGADIRRVQHLFGHASVRTTETYVKGLLPTMVRPNETPIIASVK